MTHKRGSPARPLAAGQGGGAGARGRAIRRQRGGRRTEAGAVEQRADLADHGAAQVAALAVVVLHRELPRSKVVHPQPDLGEGLVRLQQSPHDPAGAAGTGALQLLGARGRGAGGRRRGVLPAKGHQPVSQRLQLLFQGAVPLGQRLTRGGGHPRCRHHSGIRPRPRAAKWLPVPPEARVLAPSSGRQARGDRKSVV